MYTNLVSIFGKKRKGKRKLMSHLIENIIFASESFVMLGFWSRSILFPNTRGSQFVRLIEHENHNPFWFL